MKDFFEKIVQPEADQLGKLLDSFPIPYQQIRYDYPLVKSERCGHGTVRYIEQIMEINGVHLAVMAPWCDDCNQYVGEDK